MEGIVTTCDPKKLSNTLEIADRLKEGDYVSSEKENFNDCGKISKIKRSKAGKTGRKKI